MTLHHQLTNTSKQIKPSYVKGPQNLLSKERISNTNQRETEGKEEKKKNWELLIKRKGQKTSFAQHFKALYTTQHTILTNFISYYAPPNKNPSLLTSYSLFTYKRFTLTLKPTGYPARNPVPFSYLKPIYPNPACP